MARRSAAAPLLLVALLTAACASSATTPRTVSSPAMSTTTAPASTAAPSTSPAPPPPPTLDPLAAAAWPAPNASTPGAVTPGCTYPRATAERAVTQATKDAAARAYGYTGPAGLAHVEYDHRVPFSLCGGNGLANIWPELADGVTQSLYVHNRKDQLEAYAARQVRYHRWTLPFAQAVFAPGDWRAAWCRYLHYPGVACA